MSSVKSMIHELQDCVVAALPSVVKPLTLLVVRLDEIGDYVLFRNFIEITSKSRKFGGYSITLCGNEAWRELAEKFDGRFVDRFIWIDKKRFTEERSYRFRKMRNIHAGGFEVAIHPAYSRMFYYGDSIIRVLRGSRKIGSSGDPFIMKPKYKKRSDRFYSELLVASSDNLFEFYRNREFFEQLLEERIELDKPFLPLSRDETSFNGKRYAVLCPGAGVPFRRWNPLYYRELARFLVEEHGLRVYITGSIADSSLAREIVKGQDPGSIIDVTGKTTLTGLVSIISKAELVLANDSGAVHIAAAAGTKCICISNGNHFGRFVPYPEEVFHGISTICPDEIETEPFHILCERFKGGGSRLDINLITPEKVKTRVESLLGGKRVLR